MTQNKSLGVEVVLPEPKLDAAFTASQLANGSLAKAVDGAYNGEIFLKVYKTLVLLRKPSTTWFAETDNEPGWKFVPLPVGTKVILTQKDFEF